MRESSSSTKLGSRSTFSETFNYFPNLSGPSGYRYTFNSVAFDRDQQMARLAVQFE